jgi:hypothetical protein
MVQLLTIVIVCYRAIQMRQEKIDMCESRAHDLRFLMKQMNTGTNAIIYCHTYSIKNHEEM